MSFGGITSFAKNALLTAQKHIDSALHIEEEIDDEELEDVDEAENEYENEHQSVEKTSSINLNTHNRQRKLSNHEDKEIDERRESKEDDLEDVDLYGPSPPQSQWGEESSNKNQEVVDTEPNPIRDAHEPTNIYHFSPSSHSPDDDERSSQNGQSSTTTAHILSDLNVSIVNMEKTKENGDDNEKQCIASVGAEHPQIHSEMSRNISEKTLDRFEEVRTITSSDIEVIKHMDDWSITSSQNHNDIHHHNQSKIPGVNLKEMLKPETLLTNSATELATGNHADPIANQKSSNELVEQINLLTAKMKHRDQKIEELGRLNENLKQTNANLLAKNKQKTAAETKLQSQLAEKEKQLEDLLGEGKRLSEYSGRQAKEIRKLKQLLTQIDVVTAAKNSAIEELQEAHQQIQEQDAQIEGLKEDLEKMEKEAEQRKMELEKNQNGTKGLEKQLCEQITQLEKTNAEMKRMEKEMKALVREKEELTKENRQLSGKLMNKMANEKMGDEREKGLMEDLNGEKAKCAALTVRIREFEQRIESMQDAQRNIAVEISNANSPLLNTIANLEEKIFSLERQNEGMSRQLRQMNEQLREENEKFEIEMDLAKKNLEEERQNGSQKIEELKKCMRKRIELESRLKENQKNAEEAQNMQLDKIERHEQHLESLENVLKTKIMEMAKLEKKNRELQQKAAMARKEKRNGSLFSSNNQPSSQPIRADPPEGVTAEFQQGWEILKKQQRPPTIFSQRKFSTSSPTPSQQQLRVDLIGNGSDYSLDFASSDHLRSELDSAQAQLYQLHERFDHLLELYGGCLENIEEMKEDNEDLRKLCKEQALKIAEMENQKEKTSPKTIYSMEERDEQEEEE